MKDLQSRLIVITIWVIALVVIVATFVLQGMAIETLAIVLVAIAVPLIVQAWLSLSHRSRRDRTEAEYRHALFELLSESLDDVFIIVNAGTLEVDYITPNVSRLLGISPDAIRKDLTILRDGLVNAADTPKLHELRRIDADERLEFMQEWVNREDGSHHWFKETIHRQYIQDEEKFVFVLSDHTEDRIVAQGLEEELSKTERANQAKGQFLSNVSHDIRTPMNAIMGFTSLLEASADDPERVREYVRKISTSNRHLLSLINDALDMSKIESGKAELTFEVFSFADLIEETSSIIAPRAAAKGQTFEMRALGKLPEHLVGDKLRISQILVNLLSNAVKYTQAGGEIAFVVEELPSADARRVEVRFVVADNGSGMSEEYLKSIFDPFTRETSFAPDAASGTGLGMTITKSLVDLMGGSIAVESELGVGTTVTVELSIDVSPYQWLTSPEFDDNFAVEVDEDILRGLSILAAEDNELSAEMLVARLEMEGAHVRRAHDGREAVALFESSEPGTYDLILMDVEMPIMGGHEATRAIRSGTHPEAQSIPIFAMTANVFAEDIRDAIEAGMDRHIPKPIDMDELRRTADSALNRRGASLVQDDEGL